MKSDALRPKRGSGRLEAMTTTPSTARLSASQLASNAGLVWFYLKPLIGGLLAAGVMAGVLGLVTAVVGALVGPCVQVLTAPKESILPLVDLLGPRLGDVAAGIIGTPGVKAGELLHHLPLLLVVLAFFKATLGLAQWYLWERAGEIVSMRLRDDLTHSFVDLAPDERRTSEGRNMEEQLSSAITTDVKLLREYLVHFYGGLPREAFQVVSMAVMLVLLSPKLTLIFLLGVAPAAAIASRVGRKLKRRASKALSDYSQLTEWLQQRLLGVETIKHYQTEGIEIASMERLTSSLYERFLRAARVKARTSPLLESLAVTSMVIVLIIALRDIQAGRTTGAIELSFFSTLGLLSQAAAKLGRYLNSNREGAAAVERLRALFQCFLPHQQDVATAAPLVVGSATSLICQHLTARYPGSAQPALTDLSFQFNGGRIYCLAGPSGAGKSTLFNLLLGLVKPVSGHVEMHATHAVSGAPVAYMPQKVLLLPGSVAANVAYPDANPDLGRVADALDRVGMTQAVRGIDGGLDARIGDGGAGVSGGQAQRLLLARLWYHQKPFVLVDEGTSALDPEIEQTVYALLRQLADRGAVVITIAHRLAAAQIADELLLLQGGRLTASGTPTEVMASPAFALALR